MIDWQVRRDAKPRVHLIGASGRSGQALCQALLETGVEVVPVVRDAGRWAATGLPGRPVLADLEQTFTLPDAETVISCAHARHAGAVLAAAPAARRFVFLGSTRKFTRWPDAHGLGVLAGEQAFLNSRRPGVMLHPTMIYGAQGEDNVRRLAALLRRLPLVPLPGGGRALVQPIFQGDVTRSIIAALGHDWTGPESLVVAGPAPLPYAVFVAAVARAVGLRPPRVLPVPGWAMRLAALATVLPGLPRVRGDEVRRLLEDKAFDIGPMRTTLGVQPVSLEQGLALTFGA